MPAPQAPDREAGRPQRDGHHDVHGKQQPAVQHRLPSKGLQYAPRTGDEAVGDVEVDGTTPEFRVDVIRNGTFFDSWSEVVADTPA